MTDTSDFIVLKGVRLSFAALRPHEINPSPGFIQVQFWIRHRGFSNVFIWRGDRTANQVAEFAVRAAVKDFNFRWPGARRNELHCAGLSYEGQILHSKDLP